MASLPSLLDEGRFTEEDTDLLLHLLHEGCKLGNYEMCKEVLSRGANAETVFSNGTTPYLLACASGNVNLVRYLGEECNIDVTSSMRCAGICRYYHIHHRPVGRYTLPYLTLGGCLARQKKYGLGFIDEFIHILTLSSNPWNGISLDSWAANLSLRSCSAPPPTALWPLLHRARLQDRRRQTSTDAKCQVV
jgi:ankyrin repeat protein